MTVVRPFCGTRYNPKKVGNLSDVISWPYDCITDEESDAFYRRSEYNIVRLIRAKTSPMDSATDNPYTRAAGDLHHWLESGVLVTDPVPAYYYYRLGYTLPDGTPMLRKGFIGLMKISDNPENAVIPHETHDSEPTADRINLLKATGAHLSPIFCTYRDPDRAVLSLMAGSLPTDPIVKASFVDGSEHAIWRITDPEICEAITAAMASRKVMIADGHHRYNAAREFREIARKKYPDAGPDAPFEYMLTYFSPTEDEGITILPTHRAINGLSSFSTDQILMKLAQAFYIKEMPVDPDDPEGSLAEILEEAEQLNEKDETFVMGTTGADSLFLLNFKKDQADLFFPRDFPENVRILDVSILQQVVIRNILGIREKDAEQDISVQFFNNAKDIFSRIKNGAQLVFLMNPPRMETLWNLADAGCLLPTKSTYFYPKVLSGFVLHKF